MFSFGTLNVEECKPSSHGRVSGCMTLHKFENGVMDGKARGDSPVKGADFSDCKFSDAAGSCSRINVEYRYR